MSDRGLRPLFVVDAAANGALLGAFGAAASDAGGEDSLLRLYMLGILAAAGAVVAGAAAAGISTRLSEARLRLGVRLLVGLFLLLWVGATVASRLLRG
ncbi:MAG: hypothetical protein H6741_28110 [Alphaproteobacteria bacterium]|nr:hypothetical protein [Alphaproteobacteria bacterium]